VGCPSSTIYVKKIGILENMLKKYDGDQYSTFVGFGMASFGLLIFLISSKFLICREPIKQLYGLFLKVIWEDLVNSEKGWEDAAKNAVSSGLRKVLKIRPLYINESKLHTVQDGI